MMMPATAFVRDADASTVHLPPGPWSSVLEGLCAAFTAISREQWLDRMARGRVLDAHGHAITPDTPHPRNGLRVHYYREVSAEAAIPLLESVLSIDEHLVVADKPPFLPVVPSGGFVEETLLRRLMRRLDNPELVPLHRIDRATTGLVLFSANRATRSAYQALFQQQRIDKRYEALAPAMPERSFPLLRRTRLVRGEPFFRTVEIDGEPNSETRVDVMSKGHAVDRGEEYWRYALSPITGKKHQLRVHMAALGAPIQNDPWYPTLTAHGGDDYQRPLKLLAKALAFVDPLSGQRREFESRQALE
jgi:tRNA pseudouridine32 synthase/23S rRNA pseudouridine746 synthase